MPEIITANDAQYAFRIVKMWGLPVLVGIMVTIPLVIYRWSELHRC